MGAGQDHRGRAGPAPRAGLQHLSATPKVARVDAGRLARWVEGFAARHGDLAVAAGDDRVVLVGADGCRAVLDHPFLASAPPGATPPPTAEEVVADVVRQVLAPRTVPVLLVRAGGYACAVVRDGAVTRSKVGSRYVQGRTAAGGQSQQRFARRREHQRDTVVAAAADTAVRVFADAPDPDALCTGGDRPLLERVLADRRLARVAALPRGPHLAIGTPGSDAVRALPRLLRSVRVGVTTPGPA